MKKLILTLLIIFIYILLIMGMDLYYDFSPDKDINWETIDISKNIGDVIEIEVDIFERFSMTQMNDGKYVIIYETD
ncbi:MAG: hypothetical protein JSV49_02390, partial [Thermoplasmata archaeon]